MPADDRKPQARKLPSHVQSHAFELISRHGERTVAMIAHSFGNLGNFLPGNSPAEQWAAIEKELTADPRLVKTGENPGIGGDWWGLKPDDKEGKDDAGGQ